MTILTRKSGGERCLLMGNEAIARGALEAGVTVAAGYPGTPSPEIIENLARAAGERKLYVEWSVNEKVAHEVAAAASFAGLRALCVMKQNGVNVASDFLLHMALSGVRGGLVLVPCDAPGALSSANEGGQGNVMASRVLGGMLTLRGFHVTIGETFGASQRGGSVMSHLWVSARGSFSQQMPKGACQLVVALEPTEALRVLADFGSPAVKVLCCTRPVHSIGVICGEQSYPSSADLRRMIRELAADAWLIDATAEALTLGNPILGNIMMVAAVCAIGVLPVGRAEFAVVIARNLAADKRAVNLSAFDRGVELIRRKEHR